MAGSADSVAKSTTGSVRARSHHRGSELLERHRPQPGRSPSTSTPATSSWRPMARPSFTDDQEQQDAPTSTASRRSSAGTSDGWGSEPSCPAGSRSTHAHLPGSRTAHPDEQLVNPPGTGPARRRGRVALGTHVGVGADGRRRPTPSHCSSATTPSPSRHGPTGNRIERQSILYQ